MSSQHNEEAFETLMQRVEEDDKQGLLEAEVQYVSSQ